MPEFGTYLRWSDLYDDPVPLTEIRAEFAEFNLESVLEVLCRLNSLVAHPRHRASIEVQRRLVAGVMSAETEGRLRQHLTALTAAGEPLPRVVLHRHQLLVAMRVALGACRPEGGTLVDGTTSTAGLFRMLLQLSDHLETLPAGNADWVDLLPPFVLIHRFNSYTDVGPGISRLFVMLDDLADRERERRPREYVDLERSFEEATKLKVGDYLALVFSLGVHFTLSAPQDQLEGRPEANILDARRHFSRAHVRPKAVKAILDDISLPVAEHRQKAISGEGSTLSEGLVPLMDYPLIRFRDGNYRATDAFLLMEKLLDGVYWRLHRMDVGDPRAVRTWWGRLFEAYMHELLERHDRVGYRYIPEPKGPGGEAICDGILIERDAVFVFEYKSGLLSIAARYTQSRDLLLEELCRKFVDPSGVRQLVAAFEQLGTSRIRQHMQEAYSCDLGTARHAVPVLVCMEGAVAAPYMIPFMNQEFAERLTPAAQWTSVDPLVTTTVDDLERLLPLLADRTLIDVLSPPELLNFGYQGGLGEFLENRFEEIPEDPEIVRRYKSFGDVAKELMFPRSRLKRLRARALRAWDRFCGY